MAACPNVNIYALIDPETDQLRYVGKTVETIEDRLCKHISKALNKEKNKKRKTHTECWIISLNKKDKKPICLLLDTVREDWAFWEQFYIAYYRFVGCNLTNFTEGGDSGNLGKKWKVKDNSNFGKWQRRKTVLLYQNGDLYKEFNSITEAALFLGYKLPNAVKTSLGKYFTKGYFPLLKKDYEIGNYKIPQIKRYEITVLDKEDREIKTFKTLKEASVELSIPTTTLNRYIKYRNKHKEYNFKYAELPKY